MSRYERVRPDDDELADGPVHSPVSPAHSPDQPARSPPPSFHSRASSASRRQRSAAHAASRVDPALADAFGHADDSADDSDADSDSDADADPATADDRRRLMRSRDALRPLRQPPAQPPAQPPSSSSTPAPPPPANTPAGRVYGGGIQSDGVFSNLVARPEAGEEKEELPPTYEQAAADAAPPYWETTILAPGLGGLDEVYVDGMPVGSVFSFVWNAMISMSFQVVGFLLTYLLHSTHAAKNGSRAGLGITLIQYGFYMKSSGDETSNSAPGGNGMSAAGAAAAAAGGSGKAADGFAAPPDPNAHSFDPGSVAAGAAATGNNGGSGLGELGSSEWLAYVMMIVGWFVLIKAVSDYYRARRHEQLVLQSPDRGLGVPVIADGEPAEHVV